MAVELPPHTILCVRVSDQPIPPIPAGVAHCALCLAPVNMTAASRAAGRNLGAAPVCIQCFLSHTGDKKNFWQQMSLQQLEEIFVYLARHGH